MKFRTSIALSGWLYEKVPLIVELVKLLPATLLLPVTPPAAHNRSTTADVIIMATAWTCKTSPYLHSDVRLR